MRETRGAKAKNNPASSSDKAVAKYVSDLMPEDVKKAKAAAMHNLYYGPGGDDEDAPGYTTALNTMREWIDDEMPQTLYYEDWSGEVLEDEPEGFEDEEGQWIEPEDYRMYDRREIKRIVFGALVTDGGL